LWAPRLIQRRFRSGSHSRLHAAQTGVTRRYLVRVQGGPLRVRWLESPFEVVGEALRGRGPGGHREDQCRSGAEERDRFAHHDYAERQRRVLISPAVRPKPKRDIEWRKAQVELRRLLVNPAGARHKPLNPRRSDPHVWLGFGTVSTLTHGVAGVSGQGVGGG